jgi:hypothetical protein
VEGSAQQDDEDKPSAIEEVRSRVVAYIPGIHGTIGIILPQNDPDPMDLSEIHRTVAEIRIKQAKRKAAQE